MVGADNRGWTVDRLSSIEAFFSEVKWGWTWVLRFKNSFRGAKYAEIIRLVA